MRVIMTGSGAIGATEMTIAGVGGAATTETARKQRRENTSELEKLTASSCSQDETADVVRLQRKPDGESLSRLVALSVSVSVSVSTCVAAGIVVVDVVAVAVADGVAVAVAVVGDVINCCYNGKLNQLKLEPRAQRAERERHRADAYSDVNVDVEAFLLSR